MSRPRLQFNYGAVYGELTAIKDGIVHIVSGEERHFVLFRCSCGQTKEAQLKDVSNGRVVSCGCRKKTRSGLSKTLIGMVWRCMIQRCHGKHKSNKNYRDRGISVCDEWRHSIEIFVQWALVNGYKEGLQIDRINNDGNYEPNNCRFVTNRENSQNRRKRPKIVLDRSEYLREYYQRNKARYHETYLKRRQNALRN